MRKLVKALVALSFAFVGMNAQARETCRAYDHGHEEHSRGHSSCSSCLAEHGGCNMICTDLNWECTATDGIYSGRANSDRRWEAEDDAARRCYRDGGDRRECERNITCSEREVTTDRYDCGRNDNNNNNNNNNSNTCTWQEYLRQRPDVAASPAFGYSSRGAIDHYNRHGRSEGMCDPR